MNNKQFRGARDPVPAGKLPYPGKTAREKTNGKWSRHKNNQAQKAEDNRSR